MRQFCKFTYFFNLICTGALAFWNFLKFLLYISDYIRANNEVEKALCTPLLEQSFISTLEILVIGFSLTAIIYLLLNNKKTITKKIVVEDDSTE